MQEIKMAHDTVEVIGDPMVQVGHSFLASKLWHILIYLVYFRASHPKET